nr:signal peptidase II [Micromonospora sp. DSM 115978]
AGSTGAGSTGSKAAADGSPRARAQRSVVLLDVLAVSVVLVDLVSKLLAVAHLSGRAPVELVPNVLDIRLTRNSGAAFSLAGGATVVLSLVAFVVVVVIVRVARKLRSRWWAVVLGLLAGGAVGNLIDRVFRDPSPLRGHVVDWIHISHWPVFNVADAAITVGAVLAVVLSFRGIGLDGTRIGAKVDAADDPPAPDSDSEPGPAAPEARS